MDEYETHDFSPTLPAASEYRSTISESSPSTSSRRSFSPPPWRKAGSGWFKHQPSLSPSMINRPKEPSPDYYSADEDGEEEDVGNRLAAKIPLPESPVNGRSPSPTPEPHGIYETPRTARRINPFRATPPVLSPEPEEITPTQMNYIRFSTSLDVMQRTEPIEAALLWMRMAINHLTKSRWTILLYCVSGICLSWLFLTLTGTPLSDQVPDLVKVAHMAQSFQPAIYYSEQGTAQIEELHDTGLAVWDLGESVRSSNMTGAPIIVRQLDDLSESIKTLALELTRFFVSVDSDVDSILLVMEWAQRELEGVAYETPGTLYSIWSNAHSMMMSVGFLRDSQLTASLLGQTLAQRSRATLERTFHEFLNVLEESINSEINSALKLFRLLEAIDGQFLNLRRTTVRAEDQEEQRETDLLSSLWTRTIGINANRLRKFQKNRDLLASVKDRTMQNKSTLREHEQRLRVLRESLDVLRKRLVSPLVRDRNSTQSVDQQIKGLNDVYRTLKTMRDDQKRKVLELSFGSSRRDPGIRSIEAG